MSALDLYRKVHSRLSGMGASHGIAVQALLLLFFVFFTLLQIGNLHAQDSDDYYVLSRYVLPDSAVALSETRLEGERRYMGREAFSGLSYERYENRMLMRVQSFRNGILDGPSYVWYPAGEPQMAVNYRRGRLSGRFRGWYMHGSVLYDMVINDRGYAGDYIDDDGRRSSETDTETEGEGTDND